MSSKSKLFEPISFREIKVKNRIFMSPMCQYSSDNSGVAKSWHMAHYGSRAAAGIGLIIQEAGHFGSRIFAKSALGFECCSCVE